MKTSKKLVLALFSAAFLVLLPQSYALADEGRFFVKSTKAFWKNALGARHTFENGFTAELSDFEVRLNRLWGLEIEPVKILQILPAKSAEAESDEVDETPTLTPTPPKISIPSIKGKKPIRSTPSDQTPWGVEAVYNDPALAKTSGGLDIKIAVLDSGINVLHPDLKRRITQCKDFTNLRFPVVDNKCEDKNGHGTHVAGIVAADGGADGLGIYGVAPAAKLLVYKVCGANGSCYADDIAFAIRTAADQGANVMNMSFGSDSDVQMIRDALNYAVDKGVLPIAAAGNDGPFPSSIDYPGANAAVTAVGAINQNLAVTDWSSRGINSITTPFVVEEKDIEFAMPGENIESTWNNGGYAILSGTSMASPFLAGLAAKFWQTSDPNPALATRNYLHALSQDLLPLGDDDLSGFGFVRIPSL